ncbi:MAG: SDR family oxidoreductase [Acidimicrobiia bacterium]|nr:SDR family oxidoreductase [Acidimicrobiia bacterium]
MTDPRPVALVTGASAGIGREFAAQLADRGYDLVLVARRPGKLADTADEVVRRGGAADVLAADLVTPEGLAAVEERLASAERPVDLLVNNAGFGTYGRFSELDREVEDREVRLNVLAVVRLTHAALGPMLARGSGGVINVSSLAGYQPTPRSAVYGSTKAFVTNFSQSLHQELSGTGVTVTALCPGYTRTEFQEVAGLDRDEVPSFLWMDSPPVVAAGLDAFERGRAVCVPGPMNAFTAAVSSTLPGFVTRRISAAVQRRTSR